MCERHIRPKGEKVLISVSISVTAELLHTILSTAALIQ